MDQFSVTISTLQEQIKTFITTWNKTGPLDTIILTDIKELPDGRTVVLFLRTVNVQEEKSRHSLVYLFSDYEEEPIRIYNALFYKRSEPLTLEKGIEKIESIKKTHDRFEIITRTKANTIMVLSVPLFTSPTRN